MSDELTPDPDASSEFIELEGFGELYWDGIYWNGTIELPCWKDYDLKWTPEGEADDEENAGDRWKDVDDDELAEIRLAAQYDPEAKALLEDLEGEDDEPAGTVSLSFSSIEAEDSPLDLDFVGPTPAPEQIAAARYAQEHAERIQGILLGEMLRRYPGYRREAAESMELDLPEVTDAEQLKNLVRLVGINPLDVAKDGMAYMAYYFTALWDLEEGLGVVMHQDRPVLIGLTDAEEDHLALLAEGGEELVGE